MEARRERRRQRILENSSNRLKLITGDYNGTFENDHLSVPSSSHVSNKQEVNNDDVDNDINVNKENTILDTNRTEPKETSTSNTTFSIASYQYHLIVLLAILMRILYVFNLEFFIQSYVLVPFILFELTFWAFYSNIVYNNNSPLQFFTLLLTGRSFSSNQINMIYYVINIFRAVFVHFSLYLFTFLTLHLCIQVLFYYK